MRADIGYLSRRRKVMEQPQPTRLSSRRAVTPSGAGANSSSSGGLTLGNSPSPFGGLTLGAGTAPAPAPGATATATKRHRSTPSASERLFPAPDFGAVRELDEANPVVRLNARQSAIGSLLVAGVRAVAWEDHQFTTGAHHADGQRVGTAVVTPGNRPLVGVQDGAGIMSLRHVRLLRRALFVAGETPLTVGVFDGAAAAVAARNDAGLRSVFYVARVGAVLELRAEFVPADASDAAIWSSFGFTMTTPLDQRVLLR